MLKLADHVPVLIILLALPLRALKGMRSLRASSAPNVPALRRRLWWRAIATQWVLTLAVLVCTAGLCKEFLFRGYLLWYLAHVMPFALACVVPVVIFGVCHVYQGPRGVRITTFVGAFLTGIVLVGESLWPAMLLHTLMDLHAGDLSRRVLPPDPVPAAAQAGAA